MHTKIILSFPGVKNLVHSCFQFFSLFDCQILVVLFRFPEIDTHKSVSKIRKLKKVYWFAIQPPHRCQEIYKLGFECYFGDPFHFQFCSQKLGFEFLWVRFIFSFSLRNWVSIFLDCCFIFNVALRNWGLDFFDYRNEISTDPTPRSFFFQILQFR